MKPVLVTLADGFEEIEAITVIDILRRAGIEVIIAAVGDSLEVSGGHDITVKADCFISEASSRSYEMVVLPGGAAGVDKLKQNDTVKALVSAPGQKIGAICAAPSLLAAHGLIENRRVTGYPAFADKIKAGKAEYLENDVVKDSDLITSRGPGTAMQFALELVEHLTGSERRQSEADRLLFKN